jgi:membrane-bound inhibitor of C-type lysozyme
MQIRFADSEVRASALANANATQIYQTMRYCTTKEGEQLTVKQEKRREISLASTVVE